MSDKIKNVTLIIVEYLVLALVLGTIIWALASYSAKLQTEGGHNRSRIWPTPVFTKQLQTSMKGVVHVSCPQWQGSGFAIAPDLIMTARHCTEGIQSFNITTSTGCVVHATRAIYDRNHDVAVIKIDDFVCHSDYKEHSLDFRNTHQYIGGHQVKIHPLPLGTIKECVLGQPVYTIGSPYGKINFNSVTTGIISGVNRDWSPLDRQGDSYGWNVAFTTDSAGHPGNSGCPVFTMDGKVRGILVGGFSPVLICVMPCDLFVEDLDIFQLMFAENKYEFESNRLKQLDPYYNYEENNEYYTLE